MNEIDGDLSSFISRDV